MVDRPPDKHLESLCWKQIKRLVQFKMTYALYVMEYTQHQKQKSYETLYSMVNNYLEQQRKDRNDDQREADGYAHVGALKFKKGDCKQYFFTGRCTKQSCPQTGRLGWSAK